MKALKEIRPPLKSNYHYSTCLCLLIMDVFLTYNTVTAQVDCLYRYACDLKIVRLLRERGLGNTVSKIQKQLREQHSEHWLTRTVQYLTTCQPFAESAMVTGATVAEPPERPALPKPQWLLSIYVRDVINRLDDVKARLTSVFGSIIKMDSTKKVLLCYSNTYLVCTFRLHSNMTATTIMFITSH